jgi:tetratricopeptide (TPR) repeat protein
VTEFAAILARACLAGILLAACALAAARPIHYGAVTDPAVLACDRLEWRGRADEAERCYRALLTGEGPAAGKAEAAWALNDRQAANRWFRRAAADAPDAAAARVRWADLYADAHQHGDAAEIYREVLAADPANPFARLGLARVLVDSFEGAAGEALSALLADPAVAGGARAATLLLVARASLEAGGRDEALEALAEADAIVEREAWPPLDVHALRAAADVVAGILPSPWVERALAYNPHWGEIYATQAHFYVITRRYRQAIELYQQAVETEPRLATAHEALGINLLRDNQVSRARQHLEAAYREDPFSPRTVNTLRLLDSFASFRLVEDLPTAEGDMPIVLRLHEDEAAVLAPYAIELTRAAIAEFADRYAFRPGEPIIIEMYPDHEDFAVRTAGMPGIGILGATFGYVVAMDSASARPAREYQWGTTLWHELAHVFTLEATDHLVPRWFSEGISVYEEWRSGPLRGVRLPMRVYAAMQDGEFLPVAGLDEGFIRPAYDGQVLVSYMQAGLVCRFIEQRFGTAALRGLLRAFGDGLDTAEAVQAVLATAPGRFDALFAEHIEAEFGTLLAGLDDWRRGYAELAADAGAGDWAAVRERAATLLGIMPQYVEPDSPYLLLAQAEEALGEPALALAALEAFWHNGGYDPEALSGLAARLALAGRADDEIAVLETINGVDPLDVDLHLRLGQRLLAAGRAGDALREFEVALALDPHDRAEAYYLLARAYHELGNSDRAESSILEALDVAPGYRPAQRLLLELTSD